MKGHYFNNADIAMLITLSQLLPVMRTAAVGGGDKRTGRNTRHASCKHKNGCNMAISTKITSTTPATTIANYSNINSTTTNLVSITSSTESVATNSHDDTLAIALGISIGCLLLILVIVASVFIWKRRNKKNAANHRAASVENPYTVFTSMSPEETTQPDIPTFSPVSLTPTPTLGAATSGPATTSMLNGQQAEVLYSVVNKPTTPSTMETVPSAPDASLYYNTLPAARNIGNGANIVPNQNVISNHNGQALRSAGKHVSVFPPSLSDVRSDVLGSREVLIVENDLYSPSGLDSEPIAEQRGLAGDIILVENDFYAPVS